MIAGGAYLYYGAVPASWLKGKAEKIYTHLSVQELKEDMITLAGPEIPTVDTPMMDDGTYGPHIEGSFVLKRKGISYLMWSQGNWDATDDKNAYHVNYATSKSPLGPWTRREGRVISTRRDVGILGPGHHSVVNLPGTDEWRIVYHTHKGDKARRVFIDRLEFNADGTIKSVTPTLEGVDPVPATLAVTVKGGGPFKAGEDLEITAESKGSEGEIRSIEFFASERKLGEIGNPPFRFVWKNVPEGFYRIHARSRRANGEHSTSSSRNVDVYETGETYPLVKENPGTP